MSRIQLLAPEVVARIAAGEVIERPGSVVKELLENSLDAGSSRIDIELEQGGIELIRVVDDGHGMHPDDLPLAFVTHATSKLHTADDLLHIRTMGFRGEALASVGGVAQVLLQSRRSDQPHGHQIECHGGTLSDLKPWGGAVGTRLEVRHLFYTVPVRKKFLKSIATELGHVCETVTRIALANPKLHITLKHNNKLVYEIPATANLPDRIALFFGAEVRDALYPIDSGDGPARVTGYIADPKCDRGNAKLQYLFLNGRWFRDRSLAHSFQDSYRNLLMTGRYPIGFLFLDLPPDLVDVNVHPTKAEVRFQEPNAVYSLLRNTVKRKLLEENLIPELVVPEEHVPIREAPPPTWTLENKPSTSTPSLFSPRRAAAEETPAPWEPPLPQTIPPMPEPRIEQPKPSPAITPIVVAPPELPKPAEPIQPIPEVFPKLAMGSALQVHDAYIIVETPEGMLVIDQHALHERILYEQLRQRIRDGKLEVQRLLIPEPIELPAVQAVAVLEAQDALSQLGLEVADFGGNTILLSSYPTLLRRRTPGQILNSVIDYLVSKDRPPSKEVLLDHLLATMACKAAVKAGDRLSQEELSYLLHLREFAEDSHHCPHGRPTTLIFSRQELDRQFKRV
jgi:DNA mismatch repair protein MutL